MTTQDKLDTLWKLRHAHIWTMFEGAFVWDLINRKMKRGKAYNLSPKQAAFIEKMYAARADDLPKTKKARANAQN